MSELFNLRWSLTLDLIVPRPQIAPYPLMARYYFHIRDQDRLIIDDEGLELRDVAAAIREAQASARAMRNDAIADGDDISHLTVEVTSREGTLLYELPLGNLD